MPSAQVSDYLMGSRAGGAGVEQLQFNPPDLPMFQLGTVPFMGDYIDVTQAPAFVTGPNGRWSLQHAEPRPSSTRCGPTTATSGSRPT